MRLALRLLIVASLLPAMLVASSAFSVTGAGIRRDVATQITGDAAAYLALAVSSTHPFACMVSEDPVTGKLSISFVATSGACDGNGGGSGVNAADGSAGKYTAYAFHDLLLATNKGTRPLNLWVNASSTSGEVRVAKSLSPGAMAESSYLTGSPASLPLGVGISAYIGVRMNTTTLSSGSISGTVDLVARS